MTTRKLHDAAMAAKRFHDAAMRAMDGERKSMTQYMCNVAKRRRLIELKQALAALEQD